MRMLRRRILGRLFALTLLIPFLSAGCTEPLASLGLLPDSEKPPNPVPQIQLSPPVEILPDETKRSVDDPMHQTGDTNFNAPPSVTPFLPQDPSPSPGASNTSTEEHSPTATSTTRTPTSTITSRVSPTVTWTSTLAPTFPPGTQPITPTHTATRTATSNPASSPTQNITPSPTNTLVVPSPPPPTATNTSFPTLPASCDPVSNSSFESALIGLINLERQNRGVGSLSLQGQLTSSARNHSNDMACNGFFSHTGSDGSMPWDRASALGYGYSAIAENIFAGSSNAQTAFDAWINSPGHRDNMLNPTYTEIGVGYGYWADSPYAAYTTAVFARPR